MDVQLVGSVHVIAGTDAVIEELSEFLARTGVVARGDPDLYVRSYARFGADDARALHERAVLRPRQGGRRVFVIATPTMTTEAQNALLKTFEEPPAGALFFVIMPSPGTLLPTLRSRMQQLAIQSPGRQHGVDVPGFLAASASDRLDLLKPLLEKDEDDKRDLRPILAFLSELETRLSDRPEAVRAVYAARVYVTDKGALIKPLLEQVALLVPRT